jgi:hypothetical protein
MCGDDGVGGECYFTANKLTLNADKTSYLFFSALNKKLPDMPPLFYGTSPIKREKEVKYLGLYMDEHYIRGKISPMVGMLYKLKFYLPSGILKPIHHAFIHSNIQFLLIVWGSAHKASLNPIQILQNRALKSVFNKGPLYETVELYNTVAKDILPVRTLYEYQVSWWLENRYPRPFVDKLIRTGRRRFFDFLSPVQSPIANSHVISKFISVPYIYMVYFIELRII